MSSGKNWDLHIEAGVYKTLANMPRRDAKVVFDAIGAFPANPYFGDIQKMKGAYDTWRRRVGAYRVFYKIRIPEKAILVFRIERRTSRTY